MKRSFATLTAAATTAAMAAGTAAAHGLPVPHTHPHMDPTLFMLGLGLIGAALALVAWRRQ
jgi:hypothetical protein